VTIRRTILNKTGAQCLLERGGMNVSRKRRDRGIAKSDGEVVSRQEYYRKNTKRANMPRIYRVTHS
jgi:hypothetical protein